VADYAAGVTAARPALWSYDSGVGPAADPAPGRRSGYPAEPAGA
jgi:hypothetical protein